MYNLLPCLLFIVLSKITDRIFVIYQNSIFPFRQKTDRTFALVTMTTCEQQPVFIEFIATNIEVSRKNKVSFQKEMLAKFYECSLCACL